MTIQIIKPPVMATFISYKDIHGRMCCPPHRYRSKELLVGKKTCTTNRALIQFDLSSLPLFLPITNSTLHIFLSRNDFPATPKSLGVFQILSKWIKKNTPCRKTPLIVPAPLDVIPITNQDNVFVSFNITTLVQSWYTNQAANLGIMLQMLDETTNNLIGLCSRECSDSQFWPYLKLNIKDPVVTDKCCRPIDLTLYVTAKDHVNSTRPLNILLFNYSYLIVNKGIYPALAYLQVSCDGIHWQTESSVKTIAPGQMVSCVADTITKYAQLCYQAQNTGQHTELTIYIQGRTC